MPRYNFQDFQDINQDNFQPQFDPDPFGEQQKETGLPDEVEASEKATRQEISEETADVQAAEKDRGLVSDAGDFIRYALDSKGLSTDILNVLAAGLNAIPPDRSVSKEFTSWLDETIMGSEELKQELVGYKERKAKRSADGEMSPVEQGLYSTANVLEGTAEGGFAGLMAPVTITAKVTGQEAAWSRRPESLKQSPLGEAAFNIAEIVVPTLIYGGLGRAALGAKGVAVSGAGSLVAESLLETGLQGEQDELIASRTVATEIGYIYEQLTGNSGADLTRRLIQDEEVDAQAINTVVSFIQNLGINIGADKLLKAASKAYRGATGAKPKISKEARDVGLVLGRSPERVQKDLDDLIEPKYRADAEPTDVNTNSDLASKPSPKKVISEPAAVAEAMRKSGIAEDGLTAADRKYFTNWDAISGEVGIQKVVKEATSTLKKLKDFPTDMKYALSRADEWWKVNKELLDENVSLAAGNFQQEMVTLTKKGEAVSSLVGDFWTNPERYLREYSVVTEEGFIAASLVGEELGVRIQKLARQAVNLENADEPIDFTNVVEQMLRMHDNLNLFMIPLRRGKRKWAVEGMAQQRKTIDSLKDADVQGAIRERDPLDWDEAAKAFEDINFNDTDPGYSLRQLWEKYKAGDQVAGKYIKTYFETVAYVDPRSVVGAVDNLSQVVKQQLDKANLDATQALYYQFLLTRLRPQVASAGSNIARLILEPMGAILSGERAYGIGQLVGGWTALGDGMKIFKETLQTGEVLNSGSKFNHLEELKANMALEESLWKAVQKDMQKNNANPAQQFAAWVNHNRRMLANHPMSNIATRGLTAGDEASKAIFGAQVAVGRAYQFAAKTNTWGVVDQQIKTQMNNVFRGGTPQGKIIDSDVLTGAKTLTFQSEIPTDGNMIDDLFLAAQAGTENSKIFRWFNPFPKMGYNVLEQSGRFIAGMFPGGGTAMNALIPRYKAIYNGEMGDVLQLQYKSQLALAKGFAASATGFAAFGFMTGANSGSMPRQSFIVPMPGSKDGYIAIPFGKIEPYATVLTLIADTVNGFRDQVLSEGEYEKYMASLVLSLGIATTDKTFQQGLVNMGNLLNVKNFGEGSLKSLSGTVGTVGGSQLTGAPGSVLRFALDNLQPYQTNAISPDSPIGSMLSSMQQRFLGGVGLPPKVDPLTGLNVPKVTSLGKEENYWSAVASSFFNEAVFPGQIKDAPKANAVKREMDLIGFKPPRDHDKRYEGVALTPQEQTDFARKQFELGLPIRLKNEIDSSEYQDLKREYQRARKANPIGNAGEGTVAADIKKKMHKILLQSYDAVRDAAADEVLLIDGSDFERRYYNQTDEIYFGPNANRSSALPEDIQEILSIAT